LYRLELCVRQVFLNGLRTFCFGLLLQTVL